MDNIRRFDLLSIVTVSIVYVLTQWYVILNPSYDGNTILVGVLVPLAFSIGLPLLNGNRTLLYAFLAFFWALVEDGPVSLDSLFTWPEVTRFNPATPHLFLEVVYHVLTAFFLVMAAREAVKGRTLDAPKKAVVAFLIFASFTLAYGQNIPLSQIQSAVENQWYVIDVVEHLLSAVVLVLAIAYARSSSHTSSTVLPQSLPPIELSE